MKFILALFGLCSIASCQYSGYPSYSQSNPIHVPFSEYQYNLPSGSDGIIPSNYPLDRGQRPEERNQYLNGRGQYPDGRNQYPDRRGQYPDGRNQYLDRRGQYPDGRNQYPDRRGEYYPDGRNQYPDRRGIHPDGRNQYPDRRGEYPDGRNQYPDRRGEYPAGWSQNQNPRNQNPSGNDEYQDTRNQYPSGSEQDSGVTIPHTPSYIRLLKEFDDAFAIVKNKIAIPYPYNIGKPVNEPYIMLMNAINRLIDATLKADYNLVYIPTIQKAIAESRNDTIAAADSVRARLDKTASQIALLREFINHTQRFVCKHRMNCDQLIDNAIFLSNDNLLKLEAGFLIVLSREMNAFLNKFHADFNNIYDVNSAQKYLYFGKDRLKNFIENGARARRLGNGLQRPLQSTDGSSNAGNGANDVIYRNSQ